MQYHGEIVIGGQAFMALYDTGSFDVISLSKLCTKCAQSSHAALYDASASSTFEKGASKFDGPQKFMFGSGQILAEQDLETVAMGGLNSAAKVDDMPFWQVMDHTMPFWLSSTGGQFSTIAGLCHTAKVPGKFTLGMADRDTLLERLQVDRFGFCLPEGEGVEGRLVVGLSADDVAGDGFVQVPVVGADVWAVDLTTPHLASQDTGACGATGCLALVDSGSSLLLVPPQVMGALQQAIASTPHSTGDCSDVSKLPVLSFELGGKQFDLPPEAYMVEDLQYGAFMGSCKPAVAAVDRRSATGKPIWSLGLPFLRRYYTVFDRKGPTLHVAADHGCDLATPPPAPMAAGAVNLANAGKVAQPPLPSQPRKRTPIQVDFKAARWPSWLTNGQDIVA